MPIVKWPIPIIGKLADNRPIIGAPLIVNLYLYLFSRNTISRHIPDNTFEQLLLLKVNSQC